MNCHYLRASLLVLLAGAATSAVFALQDKGQDKGKSGPANASAMAAKMKEYGTPGPAHKQLDPLVGRWNVAVKMFEPGNPTPSESKGTSDVKWIMDGRFLEENVKGEWMGQPFEGVGTIGYDNLKKSYVSTWHDNMSTGIMNAEGTYDASAKSFTYTGECPDVMSGKYTSSRSVQKMVDADHWSMQAFKPGADGKEFLAGQFDYTRAK